MATKGMLLRTGGPNSLKYKTAPNIPQATIKQRINSFTTVHTGFTKEISVKYRIVEVLGRRWIFSSLH